MLSTARMQSSFIGVLRPVGRREKLILPSGGACSSLPPSVDGYSRRAAEAEDARVEAAAASRSSAVRCMTWKWEKHRRRLWWILNGHVCSPPNFHGSAACDWLYREERAAPDMTRAMSGMPIFITCCCRTHFDSGTELSPETGATQKSDRKDVRVRGNLDVRTHARSL